MKLKVIATGSKGNCYILHNEKEALIIECGIKISKIKKALDFKLDKVVGCLVTHEHKDHSLSIHEMLKLGIRVYASLGTFKECGLQQKHHNQNTIRSGEQFKIGGFKILGFDVKHDVLEPLGFLINHEETGKILFLTDTYYCSYTFSQLNNIIIEANYSKKIIDQKVESQTIQPFLRNRIIQSHFSLEHCMELLSANDLTQVNNIVLIHLSDSNSDENLFKKEVQELTGKNVMVAKNELEIEFNKTPF
jgi:phosphoribosyl 1,2-cyclic phosphodiesterase